MPAATDRIEFAPPPEPAAARGFIFAIVAHLLLLLALTWGINWKRESENVVAEAELWSSVPQQAAPRVVTAPPLPAPAPVPAPAPAPPPPPPPASRVVEPPPAPAPAKQPDIALEREKKKQELAERRREELERQKKIEARKLAEERERDKKLEARRKQEELEREKKLEALKKQEELKRQQLAQKAAEEKEKKKKEELAKAKARQEEARIAALREENLRHMRGLANATGAPSSTGAAPRAAGPSDSYAGRIRARVKPNITFTDDIAGNPTAEVEVRMAPDGTITNKRVVKSSGVKSWDEAVLRALEKTEVLPRDVDGRVHSPLIIEFRPKG
jgi:colicin import membrane protein